MAKSSDSRPSFSLGHLFLLSNLAVGILGLSYLHWAEGKSQVKVWVPNRDLPIYTQIKQSDLTEKALPARTISSESVKEVDKIRDRYTISTLSKDKPIRNSQLSPELTSDQKKGLQNTTLVGIPATAAMTLAGNLQAGDLVSLALVVPEGTEKQPNPKSIQFDNLFVIDVKSNSTSSPTVPPSESVVVLAISSDRQAEFSRSIAGRKAVLSRKF